MKIEKMMKTLSKETKRQQNLETVVSLKHLSNCWRALKMPLINSEIRLILTYSENCILTNIITQTGRDADSNTEPPVQPKGRIDAIFKVTDTKLYVSVVTLSTENDKKLLEN